MNFRECVFRVAGLLVPCASVIAQAPWSVSPTAVVNISSATIAAAEHHDMGFASPIGAVRLPNGTIAVAEAHTGSLRLFDQEGVQRISVGRSGDGPGEFRHISWIGQCGGDSVFVWDKIHNRMSVVTAAGTISREFQLTDQAFKANTPFLLSCSRRGTLISQTVPRFPPAKKGEKLDRVTRGAAPIVLHDLQTSKTDTTALVPGSDIAVIGGGFAPMPLGRATSFGIVADRLFVGTGDSSVVRVYQLNGRAAASIRLRLPQRHTTGANYEHAIQELLAQIPTAIHNKIKAKLMKFPRPNPAPSYGLLYTDTDDLVWVTLSLPGDRMTRLRAFDTTGRVRGEVVVPAAVTVFEIGHDYILGKSEDEDGEPHVVMFALRRGK